MTQRRTKKIKKQSMIAAAKIYLHKQDPKNIIRFGVDNDQCMSVNINHNDVFSFGLTIFIKEFGDYFAITNYLKFIKINLNGLL